jgi:arylsulfatase A-like enzyme
MLDKESTSHEAARPNLVFIFADQMRGMDMGCAGNSQIRTPNMDKLSEEGFMFKNAVSCFPVCTPYRACLISGRYPVNNGVMDNDVPLPIDGKGFGHLLKANGYRTGWVGKWHLFGPGVRTTFIPPGEHRHGFDDLWAGVNCSHKYCDSFYYLNDHPEKIYFNGYEPDIQTDIAMNFISQYQEEPFAIFLSWGPPHDPYHTVPEKWKELYDENKLDFRPNVSPDREFITGAAPGNVKNPNFDIRSFYRAYTGDRELLVMPNKKVLRDYYAAISSLDNNIGRLTEHLQRLHLDDKTIFVFTSDHGDMMYSHGAIQKNHPWEESIHVPFLIKYPGKIRPGEATSKPFNTVDIMPTILELMGIDVPDFAEGTSFAPLLSGKEQKLPEAAYIMCTWPWIIPEWRGIRTERYTYVETPESPLLLFDNENDPFQLQNVIDRDEYSAIREELEAVYRQMANEIGDPFDKWDTIKLKMAASCDAWREKYELI